MLENGMLTGTFLVDSAAAANLRSKRFAGAYAAGLMKAVAAGPGGQAKAEEIWRAAGLGWDVFVDPADVEELVVKNVSCFSLSSF